jgi:predicted Zn-dependent protease
LDYHALMKCLDILFSVSPAAVWMRGLRGALLLVALGATAMGQAQVPPSAPKVQTPKQTPKPTPTASVANSTETVVKNSRIDADLFYQLLVGELNARSGDTGAGYSILLDAARKTNDAQLYDRAVAVAIQARSGDAALEAARAWKQAQPQSIEANRQFLQVLIAFNRVAETLEPLKTDIALADAKDRVLVITLIPRHYSRVSDKKLAASVVEQALADYLKSNSTAAPAWTTVGRMRLAASNPPAALEAARRAQAADGVAEGPALLALELMDPQQPQAELVVKRYLESAAARVEIRMGYARALLDALRYAEAGAQLRAITAQNPDFADAWLVQGTLQVQDNNLNAADASLKRYVAMAEQQERSEERTRGLTQAYLSLSQVAEKRQDFALAESWLSKIENAQDLMSAQNRRASILAKQGKLEEGRQLIRAMPERNDTDKRMKLLSEVQLLRDQKQYKAAHDLLAVGYAQNPKDAELLYDQAMMAEKMDRFDEMERLLRKLMAEKPDYHQAYNALGYSFAERNTRLPEAKELIQKALSYAPGDPFITDSLGWVEFRMGNKTQAIKVLEEAYKNKPDPEIAAHLGEVYWMNGQKDKAQAIWKEGVLLNAENETLLETLKRLRVKL